MFIRRKRNRSGSTSIQIISKVRGCYKVVESVGVGRTEQELSRLTLKAHALLKQHQGELELFIDEEESQYESILSNLSNNQIQVVGPELIYGRLFDKIGYDQISEELLRHLGLARLYNLGSKLKAIDYLRHYMGIDKKIQDLYRFLDKLNDNLKEQVEDISFARTKEVLGGRIGVVFYDMTTLYFESSDEDNLRKAGYSKGSINVLKYSWVYWSAQAVIR